MDQLTVTPLSETSLTPAVASAVHDVLGDLVRQGAALGWVDPPSSGEVDELLRDVLAGAEVGDAAAAIALDRGKVVGFGCWRRYVRPTHRPHADLSHLAIASSHQRRGIGSTLLDHLIGVARAREIEQLTLDARGDNLPAHALWRSRGFTQYGHLKDFVAVGGRRYDKTFWVVDLRARRY